MAFRALWPSLFVGVGVSILTAGIVACGNGASVGTSDGSGQSATSIPGLPGPNGQADGTGAGDSGGAGPNDGGASLSGVLGNASSEVPGSRLRPLYKRTTTTGADGSRQVKSEFVDWYDTQRNERCSPRRTMEGLRCLPPAPSADYFADPRCTRPAVRVTDGEGCGLPARPDYAMDHEHGCLPGDIRPVADHTGTIEGDAVYSWNTDGSCGRFAARKGETFYALGDPIAPSEFVRLTEETTFVAAK